MTMSGDRQLAPSLITTSTTIMIPTCGSNQITSPLPPLRNKGRVNHTTGWNYTSDDSSSIVSDCVKFSTKNTSSSARVEQDHGHVAITMEKENNVAATASTQTIKTNASDILESISSDNQAGSKVLAQLSSPHNSTAIAHKNNSEPVKDTEESIQAITPQEYNKTPFPSLPFINQNNTDNSSVGNATAGSDNDVEIPNLHRISRGKVDVRYDMNMVPKVKRNTAFLQKWRQIRLAPILTSLPNLVPCDTVSNCDASTDTKSTSSEISPCPTSTQQQDHQDGTAGMAKPCLQTSSNRQDNNMAYVPTIITPFAEDCESCIWAPRSRVEWEDCLDELVNNCTAAAWHRERHNHKKKKEFSPPISKIYVKDRIDIDDPLRGYQIRHKTGGWLQGFIMMTTFTTWTHYFQWDVSHEKNGIDKRTYPGILDDGSLTKDLEDQPRSGDPHGTGVVWSTLAEISLVGGLGCGEYLLQMALDDIERRGNYEFVVLEATTTSRPFYEKFGFVRVGAVCKYGKQEDFMDGAKNVEITGYRHWTYANESKARLNEHGGPSWMMARRVKKRDAIANSCRECGRDSLSFIDHLATYFVSKKPEIKPLGTSGSKKRGRSVSMGSMAYSSSSQPAKIAKIAKDPARTTSSGRQSKTPNRLEEIPKSLLSHRPKFQNGARSFRNLASAALIPSKGPPPRANSKATKTILRKQKIANMYRDPKKIYYYNKVVTPNKSNTKKSSLRSKYYFVLNYDESVKSVRLIPLYKRGTFKGKREGREKWKATILQRNDENEKSWLDSMDVITTPASQWDIVSSYMVTKCSSVGEESWDIL